MKKTDSSKKSLRFTSTLERSTNKLWGAHARVPNNIAMQLISAVSRRVLCTLNGSAEYQTAILPYKSGVSVIRVNKNQRDKLGLDFGVKVNVSLRKDTSEYGLPLPEELDELLRQDKEGNKLFHALTRGKQRTLLYIIGSAKNSEKRAMQAVVIVRHLKENNGKINYKKLSLMLRVPR